MANRTKIVLTGLDSITERVVRTTMEAPADERYMAAVQCSRRELARRLGITHTRLADIFADAVAYGRLSAEWAERLAGEIAATPAEVDRLFGIRRDTGREAREPRARGGVAARRPAGVGAA